jgi:hypothetical protein
VKATADGLREAKIVVPHQYLPSFLFCAAMLLTDGTQMRQIRWLVRTLNIEPALSLDKKILDHQGCSRAVIGSARPTVPSKLKILLWLFGSVKVFLLCFGSRFTPALETPLHDLVLEHRCI